MKLRTILFASCSVIVASSAVAQVTISQSKAEAGGVTPNDQPGFPVSINQPGHYKLTSDLVVPQWQVGVSISAPWVTLDLNGYSIRSTNQCAGDSSTALLVCPTPSTSNAHGIHIFNQFNVIRNGRIYGFSGHGISGVGGERLEDLAVHGNARIGYVGSVGSYPSPLPGHIVGSRFYSNGHMGALVKNTLIERSQFSYNGSRGLRAYGGTIIDSMMVGNQGWGLEANDVVRPTTLKGNTWHDNGSGANLIPPATRSLGGNFDGAAVF